MTDVCGGCSLRLCAFYTDLTNLQNRAGTAHAALIASKQGELQSKLQKKSKKIRKILKVRKRITIVYRKSYIYKNKVKLQKNQIQYSKQNNFRYTNTKTEDTIFI